MRSGATFAMGMMPFFFGRDRVMADEVKSDMHQRWLQVLGDIPVDVDMVHFSSEELSPRVQTTFAADGPGWATARYQSPDVTIGLRADGTTYGVLGEVHVAYNTTQNHLFTNTMEDRGWGLEQFRQDIPETTVFPAYPHKFMSTPRLAVAGVHEKSRLAVIGDEASWELSVPGCFAIADGVVGKGDQRRLALLPDGSTIPLLDVFAEAISFVVAPSFTMLPRREHWPRIVIDDLVVSRRRWLLDPAELIESAKSCGRDEADRMLGVNVWRKRHGVPQRVFVKVPTEDKPYYLDFASPELVGFLVKSAGATAERQAGRISLTEMLPTQEDLWLSSTDQNGSYTSEFRIVAVDQLPYHPNLT